MDKERVNYRFSNLIGEGKVWKDKKGESNYHGTMPFKSGERVVVLKKEDLESILKNSVGGLLLTKKKMPIGLYQQKKGKRNSFTDEIIYTALDGTTHKLFLDRHFYSYNFKDMIFVRYESVDEGIIEEGMGGGKRHH